MDTPLDPTAVELMAARLFCTTRPINGEALASGEAEWRELPGETREEFRSRAKDLLATLHEDGLRFRPTTQMGTTLQRIITVPAHAAYTLPAAAPAAAKEP